MAIRQLETELVEVTAVPEVTMRRIVRWGVFEGLWLYTASVIALAAVFAVTAWVVFLVSQ